MTAQRIVTSQRGSWRWQKAYRIATYAPSIGRDGVIRWWSIGRSAKYSLPQLVRNGSWGMQHGSLHRKALGVADAAEWRLERMAELGVVARVCDQNGVWQA